MKNSDNHIVYPPFS